MNTGMFERPRKQRLTVHVDQDQRRELEALAERAGHGVSIGQVARAALTEGLRAVRKAMDQGNS